MTVDTEEFDSKTLILAAAAATTEKKASDVVVLEISKELALTDFFLICSAANDRQARAIIDEVRKTMREMGRKPLRAAGEDTGNWILLDYGDFVIHVFTEEMREYYQLERLWRDSPQLDIADAIGAGR